MDSKCGIIICFLAIFFASALTFSCIKKPSTPTLNTIEVTRITATTAVCGGKIINEGGSAITEKGVCWGIIENPTIELNTSTSNGNGAGVFSSNLTSLEPGTDYYIRAYATNSVGTAYGENLIFTTNDTLPIVLTSAVTSITSSTAVSGGSVISGGGEEILARGVCWNTTSNSTLVNFHTCENSISPFESKLKGLKPKSVYYVRAYATNSFGTVYGDEVSFTTLDTLPTLITNIDITTITSTNVSAIGIIASDGGSKLNAMGFCWSTTQHPTLENNYYLVRNFSTDPFYYKIGGLTPKTIYYVRAYATNSAGTGYGNELSFTTGSDPLTISDIDGNVYNVVRIGTQLWMKENLKTTRYSDGSNVPYDTTFLRSDCYCWYDNDIKNKDIYGALYKFEAVAAAPKNICPTGWHVPVKEEWSALAIYLGDGSGGKLKATTLWNEPNTGASNSSGFTALPGGFVRQGVFSSLGINTSWWSQTFGPFMMTAWGCSVSYNNSSFTMGFRPASDGYSVRCIRDY
jgi:uncharacterized protein (TIGR02145 family)